MYCLGCRYSLQHLGSARQCPECGRAFWPQDRATYADSPRPAWMDIAPKLLLMVVIIGTLLCAPWLYRRSQEWAFDWSGEQLRLGHTRAEVVGIMGPAHFTQDRHPRGVLRGSWERPRNRRREGSHNGTGDIAVVYGYDGTVIEIQFWYRWPQPPRIVRAK